MSIRAVVGANWGDEGKGKIVDMLAGIASAVVRYQGGANAGHTIKSDEYGKVVLHIIPSGILHPRVTNIIGNGVALDVEKFNGEVTALKERGVEICAGTNLMVSDRAQIVMPYHILFDKLEEERLGKAAFGSTKSGIAPFYSDKHAKIGFQVAELFAEKQYLLEKIERVLAQKNVLLEHLYHQSTLDSADVYTQLMAYREIIAPYKRDTVAYLDTAWRRGDNILLEGQLGALKDIEHGIYPMVTSANTLAGYASVGAGIPAKEINDVVAVTKAYSSSVGAGVFVSEIFGEEAELLRDNGADGGEFGATTGRPRRVGWFDAVATRYGCQLQGATEVVLTIVDALGYLEEIPICTAYKLKSGEITKKFLPAAELEGATPILDYQPGWRCDIRGTIYYDQLPKNAKRYISCIEKEIGFPIKTVSIGPGRNEVVHRKPLI